MSRHWWGKKKKDSASKKPEGYQPTGDSVSWDVAMSQAITALDHSAKLAIKTRSSSGMREVAVGWLAVASTLTEAAEEMEQSELSSTDGNEMYPSVGFLGAPMQKEPESPFEDEEFEEEEEPEGKYSFRLGGPSKR